MAAVTLAVDQGSSSSRSMILRWGRDSSGGLATPSEPRLATLAAGSTPVATSFPHPGWVEHDADEIVASVLSAVADAMARADASWGELGRIGLAAQTETFVVWERTTGRPVYPAISWRDTRADALCQQLRTAGYSGEVRLRTGLPLEPTFSAPKLRWLLDHLDRGQQRAEAGELLFGDVNCWLVWTLSGGSRHVTEPSMAARTMLFNLAELTWDAEMLALFGIPEQLLPEVGPTSGELAVTDAAICGGKATIGATIGDQQAALFGQRCWDAGMAKLTLGTGAFLWCQAGPMPPAVPPEGVVSSCAWQLAGTASYALEGFVPNAGATTTWLRALGVLETAAWPVIRDGALERQADTGRAGLWCVPALFGLGTPHWSAIPRADIIGLTAECDAADVAEATLLGVAHQIADAVETVGNGMPGQFAVVRVDGGMSQNRSLLQAIADLCAIGLEQTPAAELTMLGAGALAWLGNTGEELPYLHRLLSDAAGKVRRIEPRLDTDCRKSVRQAWRWVLEQSLTQWRTASQQAGDDARQPEVSP
ncbi:MAG: FGGY family carbohydrate kinase [Streptosporangiaceae bacterium]